jgi:hypothetical protein
MVVGRRSTALFQDIWRSAHFPHRHRFLVRLVEAHSHFTHATTTGNYHHRQFHPKHNRSATTSMRPSGASPHRSRLHPDAYGTVGQQAARWQHAGRALLNLIWPPLSGYVVTNQSGWRDARTGRLVRWYLFGLGRGLSRKWWSYLRGLLKEREVKNTSRETNELTSRQYNESL